MAALLALLMFVLFAALDLWLSRRRARAEAPAAAPAPANEPIPVAEPVWVAGYELPDNLLYHRGHTWARILAPDTVAVGIDDFARRLIGRTDSMKLPRVGTWVTQGAPGFRLDAHGRSASMLSPVEGEVVAVNPNLREDPALCHKDPYGRGWLCKIQSANLAANLRNLFSGTLARRWTEDARENLELRLMALSGSVLQDGGEPAPDFAERLEKDDWKVLADCFFS